MYAWCMLYMFTCLKTDFTPTRHKYVIMYDVCFFFTARSQSRNTQSFKYWSSPVTKQRFLNKQGLLPHIAKYPLSCAYIQQVDVIISILYKCPLFLHQIWLLAIVHVSTHLVSSQRYQWYTKQMNNKRSVSDLDLIQS